VTGVLLTAALATALAAQPGERLVRRWTQADGLPSDMVTAVTQDSDGFLWIGTAAGLTRFDGQEFVQWDPELRRQVRWLAAGSDGRLVGALETGDAFERTAEGTRPLLGPDGAALSGVRHLDAAGDGTIWVAAAGQVLRLQGQRWDRPLVDYPELERGVRRVSPTSAGGAVLLTTDAAITVDPEGRVALLGETKWAYDAAVGEDGSVWVMEAHEIVQRWKDGEQSTLDKPYSGRVYSVARRGEVIWVGMDSGIAALRPDAPPEVLDGSIGLRVGGSLFVDREGSLWVASLHGLLQLPEPESQTWPLVDPAGLDTSSTRFLTRSGDRISVVTWSYSAWFDALGPTPAHTIDTDYIYKAPTCVDGDGVIWTLGRPTARERDGVDFLAFDGGEVRGYPADGAHGWADGCDTAPDGSVWFGTRGGTYQVIPGGEPIRRGAPPGNPHASPADRPSLVDRDGRLWVGAGGEVCHTPLPDLDWRCEAVPDGAVVHLTQLADGQIWAAGLTSAVSRRTPDGWERHPGSDSLASDWVMRLVPEDDGSVWILGPADLIRVQDRGDTWEVVERPGAWEGALVSKPADLLTTPDGARWIANNRGVTRLVSPAHPPQPPAVRLSAVRVDGVTVGAEGALVLPLHDSRVSLRFAALSYRAPDRLRYRYRLGPDEPWSEASRRADIELVALPGGEHRLEVTASLDGARWSEVPARVSLSVPTPWWRRPETMGLGAALLAALGYGAYRLRLAATLRVERLRTRVAMDLHDEMGSTLASIGMLAGMLSRGSVPEPHRPETAGEIARAAAEMSAGLSGIVWSLKPGSANLPALMAWLARRGRLLFPGIDGAPSFCLEQPSPVPAQSMDLKALRAVQLIAFEAMNNAHKHAGASAVTLRLSPEGGRWRLVIADDGAGFVPPQEGDGLGLMSMRTRAGDIDAELTIDTAPGRGTTVTLSFACRSRWWDDFTTEEGP